MVEGKEYLRAEMTSERKNTNVLGLEWEVQQRRSSHDEVAC